eukprot:CAMPEP_0179066324 /NCGR_PEP_ID=MMETSP0796-20121207/28917_1 /TAXON_ID=73915 /ORGANISM="Pyrodinium bahamense, Strain pbaha01" /LENGTH=39 /DNA_ID= /DNA_START= /DNA_END= /DNA_ORIENTATION=
MALVSPTSFRSSRTVWCSGVRPLASSTFVSARASSKATA